MSGNFYFIVDSYFKKVKKELPNYWHICDKFVKNICADRENSHGYSHMLRVAKNTIMILSENYKDKNDEFKQIAIISAWLHDVADHKYDKDGLYKRELIQFLDYNWPELKDIILIIIKVTSYSKQRKLELKEKPVDWLYLLGNEDYVQIRHIVSDADKLEALGILGIIRCFNYANNKLELDESKSLYHLYEHYKYKFETIMEYIYTDSGKLYGEVLHTEMTRFITACSDIDNFRTKERSNNNH